MPLPAPKHRSRKSRAWAACCLLAWLCFLLDLPAVARAQAAYRLGPEDKIRLKVFEWRPSQDQIFEWKALNDDFTVSASGALSIPLIGEVAAGGLSTDDVARIVAERLRDRMGLTAAPDASIDIVQYRPFYVSGDVTHPGPYPYHPGLTVLGAVAIAGGPLRPADRGLDRFTREIISGEGDLTQIAQEYEALLLRQARLEAEIEARDSIRIPADLAGQATHPRVVRMLAAETLIFASRADAFRAQSQALGELKQFLAKEIESLDAQLGTVDTQAKLISKELNNVTSLVDKGMAVAPRQMALERSVAQITGDRLSMQTNKLRVQEEISKADIALLQLRNARTTEASTELRDTELKLEQLRSKSDTGSRLLYESQVIAPDRLAAERRRKIVQPIYSIVRSGDGKGEAAASDDSEIEPSDTVRVSLPLDDAPALDGANSASR